MAELAVHEPTQEQRLLALAGELLQRIDDLNARINDLEEWLTEVSQDVAENLEVA